MSKYTAKTFYHPELDVLRLWAFLMVFACHAAERLNLHGISESLAQLTVNAGMCGVDLFFCLSAYLITEILLREQRVTGSVDVRSFYIRRILRIWPLYLGFLAFIFFAAPLFVKQEFFPWKNALMYLFLVGNWSFLFGPIHSAVSILWSVSIEEQFYLTWPLVVKNHGKRIWYACLTLLMLATTYRLWLVSQHVIFAHFWVETFSRIDAICLGAMLAAWLKGGTLQISNKAKGALIAGGFFLLLCVGHWGDFSGTRALVTYPAVAVCCAMMLVGSLRDRTVFSRNSALVRCGRMSYGLYVFHYLALKITDPLTRLYSVPDTFARILLAAMLTFTLAAASYRWFETPFLLLKEKFSHIQSASTKAIPFASASSVSERTGSPA